MQIIWTFTIQDRMSSENIIADDKGKLKVDKKTQQLIDSAIETGNDRIVLELQQRVTSRQKIKIVRSTTCRIVQTVVLNKHF